MLVSTTEFKIDVFITTGVVNCQFANFQMIIKPQTQSMRKHQPFLRLSVRITHSFSFTPSIS